MAAMNANNFLKKLQNTFASVFHENISLQGQAVVNGFIAHLEMIMNGPLGPDSQLTWLTIFLEGFYQALNGPCPIKNTLLHLRSSRWSAHFGVPTVTFLLTYEWAIQQLLGFYKKIIAEEIELNTILPCAIVPLTQLHYDPANAVLVDLHVLSEISLPEEEKPGHLLKTHNKLGGYAMAPNDYYSQQFMHHVAKDRPLLEIGIGFGAASLQALKQGATVFCNDIAPKNLAVMHNRYLPLNADGAISVTGDFKKLVLIPGTFPEELTQLPTNYFSAILVCRVLHFFSGEKIEHCLRQLFNLLCEGGKLFVVCETPFLKNWQPFMPEYESRVKEGREWPGEMDPWVFETSGRREALPEFFHLMTKEVLERSLKRTNFKVVEISYIDRRGQFPEDIVLDGRESVGAVAVKACCVNG